MTPVQVVIMIFLTEISQNQVIFLWVQNNISWWSDLCWIAQERRNTFQIDNKFCNSTSWIATFKSTVIHLFRKTESDISDRSWLGQREITCLTRAPFWKFCASGLNFEFESITVTMIIQSGAQTEIWLHDDGNLTSLRKKMLPSPSCCTFTEASPVFNGLVRLALKH